jgi:hypothetical protein
MTVALLSRDMSVPKGNATAAAGAAPVCSLPAHRPAQRVSDVCGSRFWALAGDSSDDDDNAAVPLSPCSPSGPAQVTVG